jgi:hypothetical protein
MSLSLRLLIFFQLSISLNPFYSLIGFSNVVADRLQKGISQKAVHQIQGITSIQGETETYETENFVIKYTTSSTEDSVAGRKIDSSIRVTLTNGQLLGITVAGNGKPNYVETLGFWLEYSLSQFLQVGFKSPKSLIDDRIRVDIQDLGFDPWGNRQAGFTRPIGTPFNLLDEIRIDNNLPVDYLGLTAAHELFHKIENKYDIPNAYIGSCMDSFAFSTYSGRIGLFLSISTIILSGETP